jgi:hypothetical protein
MADVFISYSYKDQEKAETLAGAFRNRGMDAWLAHKDLTAESPTRDQILNTLNSCRAVVLLVEPASKPSPWLQLEYMTALESVWDDADKILIPVLTGKGDPPAFLQHYSVWKAPESPKAWNQFSERIADTVAKSKSGTIRTQISGNFKKEWKERLNQVERFAHKIQGESILEDATFHLSTIDPHANSGAIEILADKHRDLSGAPKSSEGHRKISTKKRKRIG